MNNSLINGEPWKDIDGNKIEAHGGSIYYIDNIYYWIGEDKSHTFKKGKTWTYGISLYSSSDLTNWKYEKHIIEPEIKNKKSQFYVKRKMDRPHLLINIKTNEYVLWIKYSDTYSFTILKSKSIFGPYQLIKKEYRPFKFKCGDFDLAYDNINNQGYIYFEANHRFLIASKLNNELDGVVDTYKIIFNQFRPPLTREGIVHFIHNDKHYLFTSGMTGYIPNPSLVAIGDDYMSDYQILGNPCINDDTDSTFNSQSCSAFVIANTEKIVLCADRWVPYYPITKEKYDVIYRVVSSVYDHKLKASLKEMISMLKVPFINKAETSKATYVWYKVIFEDDFPKIKFENEIKF